MECRYSVIIPVYNRPEEVDELLESLTLQTYRNFEVLVIEDGSTRPCEAIIQKYQHQLDITYYKKPNSGQGFTRNYGFERAQGDYFIVFDSDCIIPATYFETLNDRLAREPLDAFGGPDKSHPNFTPLQKAISYSMTSFFTTGGIRGSKRHLGTFHPRSFNMGISREVFQKTGGYKITRMGEDIEFSIRIISNGFKTGLVPKAFVYHKRRTSFWQFWKQLHFFGRARINVGRFFPSEVKPVHLFPAVFVLALAFYIFSAFFSFQLFFAGTILLLLWSIAILIDAAIKNKSIKVGLLSVGAAFIQLIAYGVGFLSEAMRYSKSPYEASEGK
jgi:glycosyltransferase involved in cell wall biosynthesis